MNEPKVVREFADDMDPKAGKYYVDHFGMCWNDEEGKEAAYCDAVTAEIVRMAAEIRAYGDECRNAALAEVERAIQNYQGRETGRTLLETIRALKEKP